MFFEPAVDHLTAGQGILHRGDSLIGDCKLFFSAGKSVVKPGRRAGKFSKIPRPVADHDRAHLGQPLVKLRQNLQKLWILPPVLQNPAFILQKPSILVQRSCKIGPQLTERIVDEPPSGRRAGLEHQKILRAKQHGGQMPCN